MNILITIPGEPKGKGRPRFKRIGKFVSTYTPEETASYENFVKVCFLSAHPQGSSPLLEGEIEAEITAYFGIPKSTSKKKQQLMLEGDINPTKKPDMDNIAKIILDSLNGIAYHDDSQIVRLVVEKRYSNNPRVELKLISYEV